MRPGARIGVLLLFLLGGFIFVLLTVGSLGEPQEDVSRISVDTVLAEPNAVAVFGTEDIHVYGWYASLDADCAEGEPPSGSAPWLERTCPLRVLMPYQPEASVDQEELEANGLRLAAPIGAPFPSRARPDGANLRLQQLVFVGHFDDPAAAECAPGMIETCRRTLVVSDYDGLLR